MENTSANPRAPAGFHIDLQKYLEVSQRRFTNCIGEVVHAVPVDAPNATVHLPKARLCFASPLTANPGYLLREFEFTELGEFFTERQTPVSQAVIVLDAVKGKPKAVEVSVLTPTGQQPCARVPVQFEFRGVRDRLAHSAVTFTLPGESTIVYANGAAEATEISLKIAELIEEKSDDKDVLDLVDFVRTHVHSAYALVDTLPKGVAFHYGKMPHLIRSQIEDLLRRRKLKYVVSTSTLLQGVNLPAQNIFVLAPRKGNGNPMPSPDFWNLAGRAGRLKETFHGNIWCIQPTMWSENPLAGGPWRDPQGPYCEPSKILQSEAGTGTNQ